MSRRSLGRVAAGLGGAALGLFALWASLIVVLIGGDGTQAPDPFVLNGDPCCSHPDTWRDVLSGATAMLVGTALVAALGAVAICAVGWGLTGRRPPWRRRLVRLPAGVVAVVALRVAVALLVQRDQAVTAPRCDGFRADRRAWGEKVARRRDYLGLIDCGTLDGASGTQVRRLLGEKIDRREGSGGVELLRYDDDLEVVLRGGRVESVGVAGELGG